ncbi:MAG: hypothetical protein ACO23F_05770 [Candidatus Limnocylindrus sp.]
MARILYEEMTCASCSGSGEGMFDGSRCYTCGGSGVMPLFHCEAGDSAWTSEPPDECLCDTDDDDIVDVPKPAKQDGEEEASP